MASVPQNIYKAVKPFAQCPDPIWECVVQYESGFNQMAVGDGPSVGGYSYGLFQLHVGVNGNSGQGNTALALIQKRTGLTGQAAITYLLQHADIQAEVGMPAINTAWNQLKNSFNPTDTAWWLQFCSISGHPGGNPANPTTIAYVQRFMKSIVQTNTFGIQQVAAGAGATSQTAKADNTWLQALINMPPHQPCSVIWRRTCPGAKNAFEGGMDLPSPNGTKVYALGSGTVIGAGYFWHPNGNAGYGVVTVRTTLPDGSVADVYYQHIQISKNIILCNQTGGQLYNGVVGPKPSGQVIKAGQLLGTVVVGEVEVGVNADWGGIWGSSHPGAWVDDPEDTIRSLMNSGGGQSQFTQFSQQVFQSNPAVQQYLDNAFATTHDSVQTLTNNPGLSGPIQVFHNAQQFQPFAVPDDNSASANWPIWGGVEQGASYPARLIMGIIKFLLDNTMAFLIRSIFVILSLIIIIALIINLLSKTHEEPNEEGGNMLPEDAMKIAEVAAL